MGMTLAQLAAEKQNEYKDEIKMCIRDRIYIE